MKVISDRRSEFPILSNWNMSDVMEDVILVER